MRVPLAQGAYQARGPTANAQVCINLYPEPNTPDSPFPISHYPAPGLQLQVDLSAYGASSSDHVRGLYQASNGWVFMVTGVDVWSYDGGAPVLKGTLATNSGNPVSMCDNQTDLVIVDGSSNGYYLPLSSAGLAGGLVQISDPAFYGSVRADFIDTFLIFNWPGTPTWYSTTSNVLLPFDAQYFAGKEGWNDLLTCVAALHDNVWVLGNTTTEIWFNAGASLFPFARMPNSVIQQGCAAPYSVVIADNAIYWISQDRWGRNMLIRGEGYAAKRVSTFSIEDEWSKYPYVNDCIGMTYQIGGHEVIGLYFPTGNAWWGYDASTQLWHKRTYNGLSTPWLPYCMCGWGSVQYVYAPNYILAGDRSSPKVYLLTRDAYTDNGVAITRQRSWMHMLNEGHRQVHSRFTAAFDGTQLSPDGINLNWSDDGGHTWGASIAQAAQSNPYGSTYAQYQWRRLGYARDRVYQLTWAGQGESTLSGAWVDVIPAMT